MRLTLGGHHDLGRYCSDEMSKASIVTESPRILETSNGQILHEKRQIQV